MHCDQYKLNSSATDALHSTFTLCILDIDAPQLISSFDTQPALTNLQCLQNLAWEGYVPPVGLTRDSGAKSVRRSPLTNAFQAWYNKGREEFDQEVKPHTQAVQFLRAGCTCLSFWLQAYRG